MTWIRSRSSVALAVGVVAIALLASGCVSPLPDTAPDAGLTSRGYVQHEYFLAGTATAYTASGPLGSDGRWNAVPTTKAFYRTRLLVRRPTDPSRFNGTVLVEWLNVSTGGDLDVTWGAAMDQLIRDGYAYVGVSAQATGVNGLKNSNPSRYGDLVHPGDDYSYDIFSQAGAVLRGRVGSDPLGGLHVRRLLGNGES